jgi:hypothetical protein
MGGGENNWEVGEFKNDSRIKEVSDAIILNLKMLYGMFNIPLDALISSNSVRSAESKQMDNKQLFTYINSQREIWSLNEANLFKVMCSIHNRDAEGIKIPKGITLSVNFEEHKVNERTSEDWMVLMNNNVISILDWLSDINPDLNRDELKRLLEKNSEENSSYRQEAEELDLPEDGQADEQEDDDEEEDTNED